MRVEPRAKHWHAYGMTQRLSESALRESLRQTLDGWDGRSDISIFAYGSLLWKPEAGMLDAAPARIYGYHREFCLWSRVNRGTPERPGLVLALARGGSCQGLIYRIPANHAEGLLAKLWHREMLMGSYVPRWLNAQSAAGAQSALTFVINCKASGFAGALSLAKQAEIIAGACGRFGHACDYLFETETALEQLGMRDAKLAALAAKVRERVGKRCP
jgi:glutathione-specific gamma-glutamylcyclotransferase